MGRRVVPVVAEGPVIRKTLTVAARKSDNLLTPSDPRGAEMRRFLFLLFFVAVSGSSPSFAANGSPLSPELQKLDISVGRWVYHGKSMKTKSGKPGSWTWNENCQWSPDNVFLECTFTNDWSGKIVKSLVVDTYNTKDHTYWHYELFAAGAGGDHPFVSRMAIHGNTWIEYGPDTDHGKKLSERIVYRWQSTTHVSVAIQTSTDGAHWVTLDQGEGIKQP